MPTPAPSAMPTAYPLVAYNYRVIVGSIAMRFTKVEGLVWERSAVTYRDGLSFLDGESISIKALYGWIQTIQTNQVEKKDVFIRLCDEKGNPVISWKAINAFPTKLSAPSFDAKSNDAAIETLDLQADLITMEET
jgi:hypothetical protein